MREFWSSTNMIYRKAYPAIFSPYPIVPASRPEATLNAAPLVSTITRSLHALVVRPHSLWFPLEFYPEKSCEFQGELAVCGISTACLQRCFPFTFHSSSPAALVLRCQDRASILILPVFCRPVGQRPVLTPLLRASFLSHDAVWVRSAASRDGSVLDRPLERC
nr:hypothetical protein Iba_chr12aCG4210 [Ipomoea batatas]